MEVELLQFSVKHGQSNLCWSADSWNAHVTRLLHGSNSLLKDFAASGRADEAGYEPLAFDVTIHKRNDTLGVEQLHKTGEWLMPEDKREATERDFLQRRYHGIHFANGAERRAPGVSMRLIEDSLA